jgi:hypothetical protein
MAGANRIPADMQNGILRFGRRSSALVEEVVRRSNNKRRPRTMYHYTNDAGLMGIIEKGEFWLTDASYLNDPTELEHGVNPAFNRIQREAGDEFALFLRPLRESLGSNLSQIARFFICSFSKERDDLGQWRAYGDYGKGYSIGFDTEAIERAFNATGGQSFFVEYSDKELREVQESIVNLALPLVSLPRGRDMADAAIAGYMGTLARTLAGSVVTAALFFKHMAYSNENEIRLLLIQAANTVPDPRYRARGYRRIPYEVFEWRRLAANSLRSIVIGPAADAQRNKKFAQECITAAGIDPLDIRFAKSRIPYRA